MYVCEVLVIAVQHLANMHVYMYACSNPCMQCRSFNVFNNYINQLSYFINEGAVGVRKGKYK